MWLAELLLFDGVILLAVLIYYRNKPKPKWLRREIDAIKWLGRLTSMIKRSKLFSIYKSLRG